MQYALGSCVSELHKYTRSLALHWVELLTMEFLVHGVRVSLTRDQLRRSSILINLDRSEVVHLAAPLTYCQFQLWADFEASLASEIPLESVQMVMQVFASGQETGEIISTL